MSTSTRSAITLVLALPWLACAPPVSQGEPCNQDSDCRQDYRCRAGTCAVAMEPREDAGAPSHDDAGAARPDASAPEDAGPVDSGSVDDGGVDAGRADGGRLDAGVEDAGLVDAGRVDAGLVDAGLVDAGVDAGPPAPMPPPGWHDADFHARRALDVVPVLAQELANVPVLVKLTPQRIDYARAGADGAGLLFVDEGGEALPYEIDTWTPGGTSYLWLRLSQLAAAPDTTRVFLYYDRRASGPAPGPAPALVWAPDHIAVYHLGDDPAAMAPQVRDSAEALVDDASGTCRGGMTTDSRVSGLLGGALSFDGVDDYVNGSSDPSFSVEQGEALTVEAWFRIAPGGAGNRSIAYDEYGCQGFNLRVGDVNEVVFSFYARPGCNGSDGAYLQGPVIDDQWHYAAGVVDRVTNELRLYVDGVLEGSAPLEVGSSAANNNPFRIGTNWLPTMVAPAWFFGDVDEVRVSRGARPPGWFATQVLSGYDLLFTVGDEESW